MMTITKAKSEFEQRVGTIACDHFKRCKFAGGRDPQVGFWIQRVENPKRQTQRATAAETDRALPPQHRETAPRLLREDKHTAHHAPAHQTLEKSGLSA